ncbi:hypothetical protein M408DRAFT_308535 [Serendipita vermifera MAFF 305830]|uniref:Uncharacterized protein n=1 Tax=Serendipita vermifera MAFF 305830 TaxID=933852 RepID=A0A0C3AJM9_SERVB|nr:hypothetical protein M408DRAFT_308535 [Serendipita vermifera MAFF 305830]
MEREVQWAKAGVKHARNHPFIHMGHRALRREQIKQLGYRLGITELLDIDQRIANSKNQNLGPKHEKQEGISHLHTVHQELPRGGEPAIDQAESRDITFFKNLLPRIVERWGKVRIVGGGDTAVASNQPEPKAGRRDASFIRYHMNVNGTDKVLYGQLQHIFKFTLPAFNTYPAKIHILALILPCETAGVDATSSLAYYSAKGRLGIADLTCMVATVGRVPVSRGTFGIVDRSTKESWPSVYEPLAEEDAD